MTRVVHVPELKRAELERLRERVGRFLSLLHEAAADIALAPGVLLPPVDLCETATEIVVRVELPGVAAESIEVALTSETLRVSGRKEKGTPGGRARHLCSERSFGEFRRVVPLRWPVAARAATAELRRGVLTVRLPKLKDRRGAEIKVKVMSDEKSD